MAEVVADAEVGLDGIDIPACRARDRPLEEAHGVRGRLENAPGLGLEADTDGPPATGPTLREFACHSHQCRRCNPRVLVSPPDAPAERQARDGRSRHVGRRNRVDDRGEPQGVLGAERVGPVRPVHGLLHPPGVKTAVGEAVEREGVEAEAGQLVPEPRRIDLAGRAMAQVKADSERLDPQTLPHRRRDTAE